jgi:hypothetical protein
MPAGQHDRIEKPLIPRHEFIITAVVSQIEIRAICPLGR